MKKLCVLLCCVLAAFCLWGCTEEAAPTDTVPSVTTRPKESVPGETVPSATEHPTPEAALEAVGTWLQKDCSFHFSQEYMNLAICGMSQEICQTTASDGGWHFQQQWKDWDHRTGTEYASDAEFFYRYENGILVCYMHTDDEPVERTELDAQMQKEIEESKSYLIGKEGLLPAYLQNLTLTYTEDSAILSFTLPAQQVLDDGKTLQATYLRNVLALNDMETLPAPNLNILCTLEADSATLCPITLTYDFTQLKPYVLSHGAQEGEWALTTNFMTMVYTFDYTLANTLDFPESMAPATVEPRFPNSAVQVSFAASITEDPAILNLAKSYLGKKANGQFALDVNTQSSAEQTCPVLTADAQIIYRDDFCVSILFQGTYSLASAAHPTQFLWALNYNPSTLETYTFSQLYKINNALYLRFKEGGQQAILDKTDGQWPDGWGDFSEVICSEEHFTEGLTSQQEFQFYFTNTGVCIVCPVPFALGDYLVAAVPADALQANETSL